jgi:N-acetylglucosaminyl-diphospho-decaprenol L-rhamnosyltransferase
MALVDVVVVSYNSAAHLRSCVEPLVSVADARVVVVDSDSRDNTLDSVRGLPLTLIPLERNRGFAHACNVGWRGGGAPFVLFLNPDATIDPGSLSRLVATAKADPEIAVVAPRIVDSDGELDFSVRRFPRLRSTYAQALFLHRVFPAAEWSDELVRDPSLYENPSTVEWASGACLLVRRSSLERLGGLDEGFFMYCEDMDLCRRARAIGLAVRLDPAACVRHEGGGSMPRADLLPVLAESRLRFAKKHATAMTHLLERGGIALGALTHMLVGRSESRSGHAKALAVALGVRPARSPDA